MLLAIHNLDIIDKHRDLVIVASSGALQFPVELWQRYVSRQCRIPGSSPVEIEGELKRHGKIIPEIAFRNFCGGKSETVVQGLVEMHNYVIGIIEQFHRFLVSI